MSLSLPSKPSRPSTAPSALHPAGSHPAGRLARLRWGLYLTVTLGALALLLWPSNHKSDLGAQPASSQPSPVRLGRPGHVHVQPDSSFDRKLQTTSVKREKIVAPILTVTGTVIASRRSAGSDTEDWQFNSPALLTSYTDWQRTVADIAFAETQLHSIRQLAESRVAEQAALVRRLAKLVEAGTDTEKDLTLAQTDLLQMRIEGRREVHEAETAWRTAQRTEAATRRQLEQAGLEPDLLSRATRASDIIVADVPEAMVAKVRLGQACRARFVGLGGKEFAGRVRSLSPVLSQERRSLRVLFTVSDPNGLLRPGMFADIGLGTDARETLLVPFAGVIHVGGSDFMLVRAGGGDWRIAAVEIGEPYEARVEVIAGLQAGDEVAGEGAILLKPIIVEAMEQSMRQSAGG